MRVRLAFFISVEQSSRDRFARPPRGLGSSSSSEASCSSPRARKALVLSAMILAMAGLPVKERRFQVPWAKQVKREAAKGALRKRPAHVSSLLRSCSSLC